MLIFLSNQSGYIDPISTFVYNSISDAFTWIYIKINTISCPRCHTKKWNFIIKKNPLYTPNKITVEEINLSNHDLLPNDCNMMEFHLYECNDCGFQVKKIY